MNAQIDETHDAALTSWVVSAQSHAYFPIQNLPLGVFCPPDGKPVCGTAIGDFYLDLAALTDAGLLKGHADAAAETLHDANLNALLGLPSTARRNLRRRLSVLLSDETFRDEVTSVLYFAELCTSQLPAVIGDYTDFYVGIHHANNVGKLFRPDNPLLPNYKFVPIGYHGRSSSIRPSGSAVRRPIGQTKTPDALAPDFSPTRRLDYELELGIWVGGGNALGQPIAIHEAERHMAGLSLLNDWSARDIQAWEYQPLGPFLAKNFMTTVSPWIVTMEALAPFRIAQPARPESDPKPMPYLWDADDQASGAFSIDLTVSLRTAAMRHAGLDAVQLSRGPATSMYWTASQIIAHHTSGGCNLRAGDLIGTGTLSGPSPESYGSLLEISEGGKHPFYVAGAESRTFLEDGDEVNIRALAHAEGFVSIGFGECSGTIEAPR